MTAEFSYLLLHSMCFDIIFVNVYGENPTSHRSVDGKGKCILITFTGHYGYSSLILHKNSTNGSFLKVNAVWNLKTYQ